MKIEKTRALEPLETWSRHEIDAPDTCPTGVPDGRTIALSTAVVQVRVGAGFIEGNLVVPQRAARLVGRADEPGIELNRAALARVRAPVRLEIVLRRNAPVRRARHARGSIAAGAAVVASNATPTPAK